MTSALLRFCFELWKAPRQRGAVQRHFLQMNKYGEGRITTSVLLRPPLLPSTRTAQVSAISSFSLELHNKGKRMLLGWANAIQQWIAGRQRKRTKKNSKKRCFRSHTCGLDPVEHVEGQLCVILGTRDQISWCGNSAEKHQNRNWRGGGVTQDHIEW